MGGEPIQDETCIFESGASGHFINSNHVMINRQGISVQTSMETCLCKNKHCKVIVFMRKQNNVYQKNNKTQTTESHQEQR